MFPDLRLTVLPMILAAVTPVMAQEAATEDQVLAASKAAFGGSCLAMGTEMADGFPPERYEVTLPAEQGMEAEKAIVWRIFCAAGAYNVIHVYWTETDLDGLKPLSFPFPTFDTVFEQPDNPESPVKELKLTGWVAAERLMETDFDPATLTFSHRGLWRGLGDASETGRWVLGARGARVVSFEVDASFDGEVNPIKIYGE